MESASRIPDRIEEDVAGILVCWRASRGGDDEDGAYDRTLAGMEELVSVFVGFLRSTETVETYSRGGATRALVGKIAGCQHELRRDAVGVIEDFSVLRRCIWRSVEVGVDLSALHGAEVSGFFAKLMQASDWLTETGLKSFDAIVRREMEQALGRAAATDLVTGLPDRDLLNRLLLPGAIDTHNRFSVAVFDVADFTETVAAGKVKRARKVLRKLAEAVQESSPEGSVFARFGDDEICASYQRDRRGRLPAGGAGARAVGRGRGRFRSRRRGGRVPGARNRRGGAGGGDPKGAQDGQTRRRQRHRRRPLEIRR